MTFLLALLTKAGAFARTPPGRWALISLAVLAALWGVYAKGHTEGVAQEKAAEAKRIALARQDVAKRETKAQAITAHAASELVKTRVEIQTRTVTLIQKVPTYVTPAADAACVVPRGFVRLHDAAAAASLPSPASGSDEAPSGLPLSAIASTIVANYGAAYDWRAEALTWRGWYAEQKAAWDAH